jgi:putative serine protease PepD
MGSETQRRANGRSWRFLAGTLIVVVALSLVAGGFVFGRATRATGDVAGGVLAGSTAAGTSPAVATSSEATGSGDLTAVIADAMGSVVSVRTSSAQPAMFGTMQVEGQGSGVIVASGLVVTNAHVVDGAQTITVSFADEGEATSATVLATDDVHDLAVLSVPTGDRPAIAIGSSSDLRLGQTVVALGYPLGLGATVTAGIVSGLDRTVEVNDGMSVERLEGLLQTDAAINPGNSGGPLIDEEGRLVGINTAGASAASAENIGFAIGIDSALPLLNEVTGSSA